MKISKNILIGVGAFIVAAAISFSTINGLYKRKINQIEESHAAQIQDLVDREEAAIARADSMDFIIAQYKLDMDSIEKVKDWYKWENDRLENELIDAWNEIFDAAIDENYSWLQKRYPSDDTLQYPFSGEQVKGIALDLVRLDFKDSVIQNQEHVIELIRVQLNKSGELIIKLDEERQDLEFLGTKLRKELAAKIEELQMSEEEVAELKRKLRIRTAGGAGTIAALAALLILL